MRAPAKIKTWLTLEKMFQWLQNSPDAGSCKRRMAIWLTHTGKLHAPKVAEILDVSTQTIWLWIRQYNSNGPEGLERKGRGGRRWAFMTAEQEAEVLRPFINKARSGLVTKAAEIRQIIQKKSGRTVSLAYVYRLLRRHNWGRIIAQSQQRNSSSNLHQDNFQKLSRPWLRLMI